MTFSILLKRMFTTYRQQVQQKQKDYGGKDIKEKWYYKCAYCGDGNNLTIDHVVPRCKGGTDFTKNVVCCCSDCNQRKGHNLWSSGF